MNSNVIIALILVCVASLVVAAVSDRQLALQSIKLATTFSDEELQSMSDAELLGLVKDHYNFITEKGQEVAEHDEPALVMCEEAYKQETKNVEIGPYDIVQTFNKNGNSQPGAKLAVDEAGKRIMIGFAGTQSWSDVKADLNGLKGQVMAGLGKVHFGFYAEYAKVKDAVLKQVATYVKKGYNKEILLTGHSLGGAEAIIAAAELKQIYPKFSIRCVTAGSPALGDADFVDNYNALNIDTVRYVNGGDVVARIAGGLAGWRHVGFLVNLQSTLATLFSGSIIANTRKHFLSGYRRNGNVDLKASTNSTFEDDSEFLTEAELNEFLVDMLIHNWEL